MGRAFLAAFGTNALGVFSRFDFDNDNFRFHFVFELDVIVDILEDEGLSVMFFGAVTKLSLFFSCISVRRSGKMRMWESTFYLLMSRDVFLRQIVLQCNVR